MLLIKTNAEISREARDLKIGPSFHLYLYFEFVRSEDCAYVDCSARMRRLI